MLPFSQLFHHIHPQARGIREAEAPLSPGFVPQRVGDADAGFFQPLELGPLARGRTVRWARAVCRPTREVVAASPVWSKAGA